MKNWMYCTKDEKIERYEQCLRVLEGLDEHARQKHWDMGTWGKRTHCGTIGCAAGHCAMDEWFIDQGLKLVPTRKDPFLYELGTDEGDQGYSICECFFGYQGSTRIFYDCNPRSVDVVIAEIKDYIEHMKRYMS